MARRVFGRRARSRVADGSRRVAAMRRFARKIGKLFRSGFGAKREDFRLKRGEKIANTRARALSSARTFTLDLSQHFL